MDQITYSTNYFTERAVQLIKNRTKNKPFYLHLTYQATHGPWEEPPAWEQIPVGSYYDHVYGSMLHVLDSGIGNLTAALREEQMWENTVGPDPSRYRYGLIHSHSLAPLCSAHS